MMVVLRASEPAELPALLDFLCIAPVVNGALGGRENGVYFGEETARSVNLA
jgi:hypothetical protein